MYIMKSNKPVSKTTTGPVVRTPDENAVKTMSLAEMEHQEKRETLLENRVLREENQKLRGQLEYYKAALANLQNMAHAMESTVVLTIVGGNAHGH
jgi:hypothetical protein